MQFWKRLLAHRPGAASPARPSFETVPAGRIDRKLGAIRAVWSREVLPMLPAAHRRARGTRGRKDRRLPQSENDRTGSSRIWWAGPEGDGELYLSFNSIWRFDLSLVTGQRFLPLRLTASQPRPQAAARKPQLLMAGMAAAIGAKVASTVWFAVTFVIV